MEETKKVEKREEINQRMRKRIGRIAGCVAAILAATLIFLLLWDGFTGKKESYKVLSETLLSESPAQYRLGMQVLLLCSNDGAKALTAEGALKWEIAYQLDNPSIAFCNEVAAIADIGGTAVHVVAENGIPHSYQVVYPIVKHAVARQGVTAVLLDNGTEDYIQIYDMNGSLRVDINTKTKTDGIPVDIALSEDGKRLVTLYTTFEGSSVSGKVTFYNAGEVGKNYIGNVVGQKTFGENILVYDIGFLEDDSVYVLYENGFSVYRMKEVPELIWEQTITNEILDVAIADKSLYIVEKTEDGRELLCHYTPGSGAFSKNSRTVWDTFPEYEELIVTEEEVIFFSPQKLLIYRENKSLKYEGTFQSGLEKVLPLGDDKYFLIDSRKIQAIKLINRKEGE